MKYALPLCFFLLFSISRSPAQDKPLNFLELIQFLGKHHRVPESVKTDCDWNYAVVKLTADKNNEVVSVDVINEVSKELKKSFDFLKGYRFPKPYQLNQRPVVFILSVDRTVRSNCSSSYPAGFTPSRFITDILQHLKKQLEEEPDTIILYDVITAVISPPSH